jgi:hypothetical protein
MLLAERGCVREHQPQHVEKLYGHSESTNRSPAILLRLVFNTAALRPIWILFFERARAVPTLTA